MPLIRNQLRDMGFDVFNRREPIAENRSEPMPVTPNVDTPLSSMNQVLPAGGIDFDKLTINRLFVNQNMESSNFLSGSTGWQVKGNGDVEFNDGTFRGDVEVGSLHIPDQDTTANSFHTDTDGNSWWGATQTQWDADNDNALAWVKKDGTSSFQSTIVNGSELTFQNNFGDGSDGDVTISADTTLTSDMFYNNLTVNEKNAATSLVVETTTSAKDGYSQNGVQGGWSAHRLGAGIYYNENQTTGQVGVYSSVTTDEFDNLRRGFCQFDASALPADAIVTSATLDLYITSLTDNLSQSIAIAKSTKTGIDNNNNFNIANWVMTAQATAIPISSLTTSAYNTFNLNAAGLTQVSDGAVNLSPVLSADIDDVEPTWQSGVHANAYFATSESANPPKLTINYYRLLTLDTGGFRIFTKGTMTVNGTVSRSGSAGTAGADGGAGGGVRTGGAGGTGGAGSLADGSVKGNIAGEDGGAGGNGGNGGGAGGGIDGVVGGAGTSQAKCIGGSVAGARGGYGGIGGPSTPGDGAVGGVAGANTGTVFNSPFNAVSAYMLYDFLPSGDNLRSCPSSGGSGGGGGGSADDPGDYGGAGGGAGASGSSGGIICIFAKTLINTGSIIALGGGGGDGGDGSDGNNGAGAGGSAGGGGGGAGGPGGGGGVIVYLYSSLTNTGSISATGGVAGAAGSKGLGYHNGSINPSYDGDDGAAGDAGSAGVLIALQI